MQNRDILRMILAAALSCAALGQVSEAKADPGGRLRVTLQSGKQQVFAPVKGQVAVDQPRISANGEVAAWTVEYENCCTSYPVLLALRVYARGRIRTVRFPQMIWDWGFVAAGKQIAVLYGPVHGNPSGANLYDSASGKLLKTWDLEGSKPDWAAGLKW
jgi:hypothetical protein